jgi:hypothetical protein
VGGDRPLDLFVDRDLVDTGDRGRLMKNVYP